MSSRALLLLGTVLLAPACTVHTGTYPEPAAPVLYRNAPVYSNAPVYAEPGAGTPAACTPVYAGAPIYTPPVRTYTPAHPAPAAAPAMIIPAEPAPRIVVNNPRVVAPRAPEPPKVHALWSTIPPRSAPAAARPASPRVAAAPRVVTRPAAKPSAAPSGPVRRATDVAVVAPRAPEPRVVRAPARAVPLRPLAVNPEVYQPVPRALRTTMPAR
jgi:hypothetical protein